MHISPVLWQFLVHWLTNSALFPPEASAISPYMDAFYFFLCAISAVGLIAVAILVFGFSIMYRKEKSPVATQIEGSTLLEATWTTALYFHPKPNTKLNPLKAIKGDSLREHVF